MVLHNSGGSAGSGSGCSPKAPDAPADPVDAAGAKAGAKAVAKSASDFEDDEHGDVYSTEVEDYLNKNRGLTFVAENLGEPGSKAMEIARNFESGTSGAFSNVAIKQRMAPALKFTNPNSKGKNFVKFDGFEELEDGAVNLVDAKTRLVPFATKKGPFISKSVRDGLTRKSLAISQNSGFNAVLEFPDQAALREARKVLRKLGITNIKLRVR